MSRSKQLLVDGFENMKILMQYLYMSEEHSIVIKNCIDVPLELSMNDDGIVMCKNLNFPEFQETVWQENMDVESVQSICEQLIEQEPQTYKENMKNRWEEICFVVSVNISQNKLPLCISHIIK